MLVDKELEVLSTLSQKIDVIKHCLWPKQNNRRIKRFKTRTRKWKFLARYKKSWKHKQKC